MVSNLTESYTKPSAPLPRGPIGFARRLSLRSSRLPPLAQVRQVYATFQQSLKELSQECDAFNDKALAPDAKFPDCFGMWQTNPKYLETAVSV